MRFEVIPLHDFVSNLLWILAAIILSFVLFGLLLTGWIGLHIPFVSRAKYDADLATKDQRAKTAENALRQLDRWYADAAAHNTMLLEELARTREANQTLVLSLVERGSPTK